MSPAAGDDDEADIDDDAAEVDDDAADIDDDEADIDDDAAEVDDDADDDDDAAVVYRTAADCWCREGDVVRKMIYHSAIVNLGCRECLMTQRKRDERDGARWREIERDKRSEVKERKGGERENE